MIQAPDLPLWAAIIVALLLFIGAAFTLIGSLGLLRLNTFYDRAHAPTIGSSAGVASIALASVFCFSVLQTRLAFQELLIFLLVTITMPVTLMLLARAALFRDRIEGNSPVPPRFETLAASGDVPIDPPLKAAREDVPPTPPDPQS